MLVVHKMLRLPSEAVINVTRLVRFVIIIINYNYNYKTEVDDLEGAIRFLESE